MKKPFVYILLAIAAIVWGISFILTKELFRTEPHITVFIILTFRLRNQPQVFHLIIYNPLT